MKIVKRKISPFCGNQHVWHNWTKTLFENQVIGGQISQIKFCKLVLVLSNHVNLQIIMYVLASVDVGFLKAHLPIDLVPSTSANHLGLRLELDKVPGSLHALMAGILVIF